MKNEVKVKPRAGRGVGIVEAPRGILFHDYTFDDDGNIVSANFIIPTNQNHQPSSRISTPLRRPSSTNREDEIRPPGDAGAGPTTRVSPARCISARQVAAQGRPERGAPIIFRPFAAGNKNIQYLNTKFPKGLGPT